MEWDCRTTKYSQKPFVTLFTTDLIRIGRDSSVGIATCYGLDVPWIESRRGGRDFSHPLRPVLGPTQPPVQWVPGVSRGWSGWGVEFTTQTHLAPRLKKEYYTSIPPFDLRGLFEGELYLYQISYGVAPYSRGPPPWEADSYRPGPYLLTPWCRDLLEKLTGLQLVMKFPAFYGTRRFITALTKARHLSLSWASPIQSSYPHPTSWRSILILSTHLRLCLPSGFY